MPKFFRNNKKTILICSLVLMVAVSIVINKFNVQEEDKSVFASNGVADENSNFYKPPIDAEDAADRFIQQASQNYFFREFDKGAENYRQAIAIYEEREDFHRVARTYESLGDIYQFAHRGKDAESSYLKAVNFHNRNHDAIGEGRSLTEIGALYRDQQNFGVADEWYQKAGRVIQGAEPRRELAKVYESLGRYYWDRDNLPLAAENFLKSQEVFVVIKDQMGYDHITKILALLKRRSKPSSPSPQKSLPLKKS